MTANHRKAIQAFKATAQEKPGWQQASGKDNSNHSFVLKPTRSDLLWLSKGGAALLRVVVLVLVVGIRIVALVADIVILHGTLWV